MDFALDGRLLGACAVVALVLVGLKAVAGIALRPGMPASPAGRLMNVVETTLLPGAASLHVVRIAERYYAIGRSGGHVATLCEIPSDSVAHWRARRAGAHVPIRRFRALLQVVRRRPPA
jgi:hypothetical protein